MKIKEKIIFVVLCLLSVIIMMPFAEAKTTAYYKKKNGDCNRYPDLPAFCIQPGVNYNGSAAYERCDVTLTCYDAAAAWYGYQFESTNKFWAAQTILNGRDFFTDPSCSTASKIPVEEVNSYAMNYCTLPGFGGTEFNMKVGEQFTITDSKNVLSDYNIYYNTSAFTATKSGNKIIIEPLSEIIGAEILIYKGYYDAVVGKCSNNSQNLVEVKQPPYLSMKLKFNVTKPDEASSSEEPEPIVKKIGGLKILKVDENGDPVPHVKFKLGINLFGEEGSQYRIKETDANGIVTYDNIVVGSAFYFQEIEVPEGMELNPKINFIYIAEEKTYEVRFINTLEHEEEEIKGRIKVIKVDEDGNKLEGVEFRIGNEDVGYNEYVTDQYGEINIPNLPVGEYKVTETSALDGYVFDEDEAYTYTLVINEEQTYDEITIKNKKYLDSLLTIYKVDKESKEPLANVKINIYNEDGSLYETATTDENGIIIITDIEIGEYYLEEVEAPTGYKKLEGKIEFEITREEPRKTITIYNEIVNGKTGELNVIIPFTVVLLMSGGAYLVLKKREKLV